MIWVSLVAQAIEKFGVLHENLRQIEAMLGFLPLNACIMLFCDLDRWDASTDPRVCSWVNPSEIFREAASNVGTSWTSTHLQPLRTEVFAGNFLTLARDTFPRAKSSIAD